MRLALLIGTICCLFAACDHGREAASESTPPPRTSSPSRSDSTVEPAAGSRYVDIPVTILARSTSGDTRRFEGVYTMRRVVVDGAPASARQWHIHRAKLRPAA